MIENDKLLFLGFVGVIVIIWYILFYVWLVKRRKDLIFVRDVWIDEVSEVDITLQSMKVYKLSECVTRQEKYYQELIKYKNDKRDYLFFHPIGDKKGQEEFYKNMIIATELVLDIDSLEPNDQVVISISGKFYLRKVYKLDFENNIIYYKEPNNTVVSEAKLYSVVSKVKLIFSKDLLKEIL